MMMVHCFILIFRKHSKITMEYWHRFLGSLDKVLIYSAASLERRLCSDSNVKARSQAALQDKVMHLA